MNLVQALALLEQWPWVRSLATSVWAYPLVSTLHLLGIALLIGCIVPVDLRLLGLWRDRLPAVGLGHLRRIAVCGLLLALGTGLALFGVRASEYIENPYLLAKWGLVGLAIANALVLGHRRRLGRTHLDGRHARVAGALSIACWLGALACGRWIAFA
jgi:hypothetical protein